jgi:hypothetical protein
MTTISFVAGLLPLLISTGPGAEERRSIAVLAVGGQTLSLLLTLLAIPVIYSYLDDVGALLHRLVSPSSHGPAVQGAASPAEPEGAELISVPSLAECEDAPDDSEELAGSPVKRGG